MSLRERRRRLRPPRPGDYTTRRRRWPHGLRTFPAAAAAAQVGGASSQQPADAGAATDPACTRRAVSGLAQRSEHELSPPRRTPRTARPLRPRPSPSPPSPGRAEPLATARPSPNAPATAPALRAEDDDHVQLVQGLAWPAPNRNHPPAPRPACAPLPADGVVGAPSTPLVPRLLSRRLAASGQPRRAPPLPRSALISPRASFANQYMSMKQARCACQLADRASGALPGGGCSLRRARFPAPTDLHRVFIRKGAQPAHL